MSVWFPMLPINVLRRRDGRLGAPRDRRPIVLEDRAGQRRVVAACCERAAEAGVRLGMPVGEARAMLPVDGPGSARIEPFDPARDQRALRALAGWAHRFSPVVAIDEPDGLLIDVTGCAKVFRGERRLMRRVQRDCEAIGFPARAAVAPTFGAAWALTRYGTNGVCTEADPRESLAPLPISSLRIEPSLVAELAEVGVERIDQLLALPRRSIPSRFGEEPLLRLDRALGRAIEVIRPFRPAPPLSVEQRFQGATTQREAIEITVQRLLGTLTANLAQRERGVRRLDLSLARIDSAPAGLTLDLSRPTREARRLWAFIRPRLERVNFGFGVEGVALTAAWTAPLRHEQAECWPDERDGLDRDEAELVDTLSNRLGPDAVRLVELTESHLPERAFRVRSVTDESPAKPSGEASPPAARPSLLLDEPAPAHATFLTPDGPVMTLRWRGEDLRIVTSVGPERLAPEWWRRRQPTRDYFRVQDHTGRWLWVFRDPISSCWFIHGLWA